MLLRPTNISACGSSTTRVGLVQEPFVSGADTMIDRVVANIPDAERGFTLLLISMVIVALIAGTLIAFAWTYL